MAPAPNAQASVCDPGENRQENDLAISEKRDSDAELPLHSSAERCALVVDLLRQSDLRDHLVDGGFGLHLRHVFDRREQLQVLLHGQKVEQNVVLKREKKK